MAIKVREKENGELEITFSNGELKALREVEKQWRFRGVQSFLEYALAVFLSKNVRFTVKDENGSSTVITPTDELLRKEEAK